MTYRSASRNAHFQTRAASSSQTGYGNAWAHGGDPIDILPTCKEQLAQYRIAVAQLRRAVETTAGKERQEARARLADALRHIGSLRATLQTGSRLAFEKIFVVVAQHRLPKDKFLILVEEAREIWRQEGFAEFVPEPSKRDRRLSDKREMKRALLQADAHFET